MLIYVKEYSMFSFRSFIVPCLTFRPLTHFEFTFVYGIRECSNFILLHVAAQFSQHHVLKMSAECIFLGSVSSQQKFEAMDVRALGVS